MAQREHTSTHYEQQLRELKNKLLLMSHKAEQMISDSIRSLVERRPNLAEAVIARDDEIDKLEMEVDDLCRELLALEQPVASDLRLIATAMKIVKDIERIGDIGVNIGERVVELIQEPELKPIVDLPIMAEAAQKILKESLDAFVNSDTELAQKVISKDDFLDELYEQIFRELLTYMLEDPRSISRAIKLIFIAKALERVGDHSANVAEMVVFLVKGQDIRHGTRAHTGR
jgi:phosphate transport system protein